MIPQVTDSQIIFDEFVKVRKDKLQMHNHEYSYYSLITRAAAVVVLALNSEGKWVFNEEYRHPIGKYLLSCAGGFLEEGESPIEAAKRELLEETGHHAETLELMGSAYPMPGLSTQNTFYVLAKGALKVSEPILEGSEVLNTILKTDEELKGYILSGKPLDGTLLTALAFYNLV